MLKSLMKKLFNQTEDGEINNDADLPIKDEQHEGADTLPPDEYEIIAVIAAAVISSITGMTASKFRISSIKRTNKR